MIFHIYYLCKNSIIPNFQSAPYSSGGAWGSDMSAALIQHLGTSDEPQPWSVLPRSQSFSLFDDFIHAFWIASKASADPSVSRKETNTYSLTSYLRPPRCSTEGTPQEQSQENQLSPGFPLCCEGLGGPLEQAKAFCVFQLTAPLPCLSVPCSRAHGDYTALCYLLPCVLLTPSSIRW